MPASPAMAERLAQDVTELYAEAERQMIARLARAMAKDVEKPYWAEAKAAQLAGYRRQCELLLDDLRERAQTGVETALTQAYDRGGLSAVDDIARLRPNLPPVEPLAGLRAVEALVNETISNVVATHPGILRTVTDAYRSIVAETAQQVLLGTQTRRQAAQAALNRFAQRGITGFVDKAGRLWFC